MWRVRRERVDGGEKIMLTSNGAPMAFASVLEAWKDDERFTNLFLAALAATPFAAFYWEMPPIVADGLRRPFEYVVIDAPGLRHAREDGETFREPLATAATGATVTAFPNLRASAMLVAPLPMGLSGVNAHIATFVRGAPRAQQRALLALVAEQTLARLSEAPTWISTSGDGVSWLHVRIEDAPTYYTYRPYRRPGA
jgi:hypothetical protein